MTLSYPHFPSNTHSPWINTPSVDPQGYNHTVGGW